MSVNIVFERYWRSDEDEVRRALLAVYVEGKMPAGWMRSARFSRRLGVGAPRVSRPRPCGALRTPVAHTRVCWCRWCCIHTCLLVVPTVCVACFCHHRRMTRSLARDNSRGLLRIIR